MELKALEDLFLQELAELYDAEGQILKALPPMAKAADCKALKAAFENHLKQTARQVERLDRIFKAIDREPGSGDASAVSELVKQGQALIASKAEPAVLDAALIAAAQKVEHYEIASYGSARSHAKMLGYSRIAALLEETLREEEQTDLLLTELATRKVNVEASRAPFANARYEPRGGEEGGGWGFGAILTGIFIGAAVALLYTPKTGERMRSDLKDTADQWRGTAESLIERGKQAVGEPRREETPA